MLISISELTGQVWEKYFKFFKTFIPYLLIIAGAKLVIALLAELGIKLTLHTAMSSKLIDLILLIFIIAGAVVASLTMLAFTKNNYALAQDLPNGDWRQMIKSITKYFFPTILLSIVFGLIIILGSLLFIIPGVIFFVWYYFSFYQLLLNNKTGLTGLSASKDMVVGRWWATMWRLVIPKLVFVLIGWLIYVAIFTIFQLIFKLSPLNSRIFNGTLNYAIVLLYSPAILLSDLLLFKNLQENKTSSVK